MNTKVDFFGVSERKGIPVVSSRKIAEVFKKEHKNVLQSIRDAIVDMKDFAAEFSATNFIESRFKDRGKRYPEYLLTKDGFTYIALGFKGRKASEFKIAYIQRFNEMEQFIEILNSARLEYPEFTNAILTAHDEPKHYHFSNEINMINAIVLGMNAKQFKEANGLGTVQSIRPYLSLQQISAIEKLQRFDAGLLITEPDFQKRKETLTNYYIRISQIKLLEAV